jgi:uncharacterized membrane protein HdeD (DUF308 family)
MTFTEWALVFFGFSVAFGGSWIQLHPERIFPVQGNWRPEAAALAQVSMLGGCFVFMGIFFATQMAIILIRQPWWMGTLSGMATAVMALTLLSAHNKRHPRENPLAQTQMDEKVLSAR